MENIIISILANIEFFGIKIIELGDFLSLIIRFTFNTFIIFVAIRWLYYPTTRRKDYLFTFILIGVIIFLLCFLLENVKLQLGFALGLFAVFGIIRYRTDQIPIKEMTYLFLVIGISVVNALANKKVSYAELIFTNFMVLFITYMLERVRPEITKIIVYEKIDMVKKSRRAELIQDLEERTGLTIIRLEVGQIDFMRDIVFIRIFYYEDEPGSFHHEGSGKQDDDND
jgi:Domain of unknown function (DUF4956)